MIEKIVSTEGVEIAVEERSQISTPWFTADKLAENFTDGDWVWVCDRAYEALECGYLTRVKDELRFCATGTKGSCEIPSSDLICKAIVPAIPKELIEELEGK